NIRLCWQSQQCALWGLCDLPYRQDAPKPHRALIFAYVGKANNALYGGFATCLIGKTPPNPTAH
ncbi:MAG: hypothetical protein K0U39_00070, partial [Alphaproteobacteria bacterium]|nr:hypothetical protein [Alphaproteobacteria bacterium]